MTDPSNPLVAAPPAEPGGVFNAGTGDNGWATGISIAESAMDTFNGIKDGNWIQAGLGMVGLAADAAAMAIDPFGTLMSSAASFLMEHVQPLKDMLDWLAGNPPVIESYATTWNNVGTELGKIAEDYKAAVARGTAGWGGAAAAQYLTNASAHGDALTGAASAAGTVGTVVGMMGMVVGFVREMVRDLIADLVGKLIAWVLEAVFSLGFGTPVIVAQAVTAISKWAAKIAKIIQDLLDTIKKVSPMLKRLVEVFEKVMKVLGKIAGKATGLDVLDPKNIKKGGFLQTGKADVDTPNGSTGNSTGTGSGDGDGTSSGDGNGDGSGSDNSPGTGDPDSPTPSNRPGEGTTNTASTPTSTDTPRPGRTDPGDTTPTGTPRPGRDPGGNSPDSDQPRGVGETRGGPGGNSPVDERRGGPGGNSPTSDYRPAPGGTPVGEHRGGPGGQPSPGYSSTPGSNSGGPGGGGSPGGYNGAPGGGGTPGGGGGSYSGGGSPNAGNPPNAPTPTRYDQTSAAAATPEAPARPDQPHTPTTPGPHTPTSPAGGAPAGAPGGGMPGNTPGGGPGGTPGGGAPGSASARPGGAGGWTGTPGTRGDLGSSIPHARTPEPPRTPTSPHHTPPHHTPPHHTPPNHTTPSHAGPTHNGPGRPNAGPPHANPPHAGPPHAGPPHAGPPHAGPPHAGPARPGPGPNPPHHGPTAPGAPHNRPGPIHNGPPHAGPHNAPNAPGRPDAPHTPSRPDAPNTPGRPDSPHDPKPWSPPHRDPDSNHPNSSNHPDKPDNPNTPDTTPDRAPDRTPDIDEAHARHGETTPSGISHHRGDPDMGDLPHRVPHDPRYFTADVHITPDGRARIGNHTYTPEQYGDLLRRNGWDGKTPIRLIGCDAGTNDFARRLSHHTGADVLAPTKPAWTDSKGRVYTSDAEIGPDGNRQPKIPPNGEWETHRPDGTKTKTGEDGYVPGTPDHHRTNHTDADDARDRGQRDWKEEPGKTSGKTPNQKIADRDYLKEHYYLRKTDGRWQLVTRSPGIDNWDPDVNVKALDLKVPEGWTPPRDRDLSQLDLDEVEITFQNDRPPAEPASYHQEVRDVRGTLDQETIDSHQALIDERRAAIDDAKAKEGTDDYPAAQTRVTKLGEELGETAGRHYLADRHGTFTRVDAELGGSGRFDVVGELPDTRHEVVEAKGPSQKKPGEALAQDGTLVQQGHDKYWDKKIHDMKTATLSGEAEANMRKRLADEGKTPDEIDRAVDDHLAKLDHDRELAKVLEKVRDPQVLADHLRGRAGVSEHDIDEFLRAQHGDRVNGMSPEEFTKFKQDGGYNEFFKNHNERLAESSNPADRELARQLEHVRTHGMVEYTLVTAKVKVVDGQDVYDGYIAQQFLMGWQRDITPAS
ncbi:hypothetical protein SUDANB95_01342 [Actinosynnema sp. ALI-1.44]